MKTTAWILILCLGTAAPLLADGTNNVLTDEKDQVSYAVGMMIGHSLQQSGLNVNPEVAARAIKDVQSGGTTLLTPQEATQTIRMYQMGLATKNKVEGEAFLATNKNNPGVVTLPDGLQYQVITNGTGAIPTNTDIVTVNYRGTLLDGTEFDSTYKSGQPRKFPVARVIRGWTEALLKMRVGSRWRLFIPPELTFGGWGHPSVPANSVLIFDMELLSAQSPPPSAASNSQPLTSDIIKVPSAEELKKGAKIEVIKPEDVENMQKQKSQ